MRRPHHQALLQRQTTERRRTPRDRGERERERVSTINRLLYKERRVQALGLVHRRQRTTARCEGERRSATLGGFGESSWGRSC